MAILLYLCLMQDMESAEEHKIRCSGQISPKLPIRYEKILPYKWGASGRGRSIVLPWDFLISIVLRKLWWGIQVQRNPCENWVTGGAYCAQENTGFVQDRYNSIYILCNKATTSVPSALPFKAQSSKQISKVFFPISNIFLCMWKLTPDFYHHKANTNTRTEPLGD